MGLLSTLIGGVEDEYSYAIAADVDGNAYITGYTWGNDFPVTEGAYKTDNYMEIYDLFITKFNPSGTDLVWSTFLLADRGPNPARGKHYLLLGRNGPGARGDSTECSACRRRGCRLHSPFRCGAGPRRPDRAPTRTYKKSSPLRGSR